MESALLRTQKLMADRGKENCSVQADITRVFMRDAAVRIERAAQMIATETAVGVDSNTSIIDHLVHRAPIKAIAARRRIAEAITEAGRYNL
jgi:hypothetical protein